MQILKKIGMIILGLILSFLFIEVGVRILKRDIAFQPDPELIRSLRPNIEREIYSYDAPDFLKNLPDELPPKPSYIGMDYTNNIGFRMKGDVGPKQEREKRVLFLGDSFAEADGVSDSERFYYLVQQQLENKSGSNWRVLNGAIQNGSPVQYILQLKEHLKALRPDVVILFSAPNDLTDDFNFENQFGFAFDNRGFPQKLKSSAKLWVLQKFWALRYLDVLASRKLDQLHRFLWPSYLAGETSPDWVKFLCGRDQSTDEWFSKKTGRYIGEIKEMVNNSGAEFGVFLINYMNIFDSEPIYKNQINSINLDNRIKKECSDNKGQPYRDFMYQFLRDQKIWFRDSYDALLYEKTREPSKKLWYYYDYHFSPAGHRVVADEIVRFLSERVK